MKLEIAYLVKQCRVCTESQLQRCPPNPEIREILIPEFPGQIVHIDIYSTENTLVLTAIDKFLKVANARIIKSKAFITLYLVCIKNPLHDIEYYLGMPECIVMNNEKSLNSTTIKFMPMDQINIQIY